ncbi:MAG TPA: hypothetical protein PLW99_02960 [Candidatus Paceibacterota bacterium]|nr:MAG: hypothetical protein B7X03_01730 [Parcubacteria group bacterium 21-58-10]HQT83082.1 hypothetical protein [Candidatus Paceibacterota bacterium]
MKTTDTKNILLVQTLLLFGGTVFAWSATLSQFSTFHSLYGTLFRFTDCTVPNPLTTACFYGSTAFLVALFWSVRAYQRPHPVNQRRLRNFLLFCVVFAASVVAYEAVEYYKLFGPPTSAFICTPGVSPVQSPCFTGLLFFIAAFVTAVFAARRLKSA